MRYFAIRETDISNGEGIGIALFVQGCPFRCRGCFNKETWDFKGGKVWDKEFEEKFLQLADKPYIKRISILGGEPLANENVEDVYSLTKRIRARFKRDKKIWLYTGFAWEDINNTSGDEANNLRFETVKLVDIVIDGQFKIEEQDLYNKEIIFAGSTNQRIIDVEKSIMRNDIVLYEKGYK